MTFQFYVKRYGLLGAVAGVPANAGTPPANQWPEPTGHLGFQLYLLMSNSPNMVHIQNYDTLANAKAGALLLINASYAAAQASGNWTENADSSTSISPTFAPA